MRDDDRRSVYRGSVVDLGIETVHKPDGSSFPLEVIRHPGAAAVVPLDDDGQVVMVRQYRHATGDWLLEVPAGKRHVGEDPRDCAVREVTEEIGMRPTVLEPLGAIWTTPGFADERIWLYLATHLEPATQNLDDDELLEVVRLPFEEAVAQARDGRMPDAKSAIALLRAAAHPVARAGG